MPIIQDYGNGTFLWAKDEQQGGGPEGIKRQTAEQYAYTPQARQELTERENIYLTPTRLRRNPNHPEYMENPTDIYGSAGRYRLPSDSEYPGRIVLATPLESYSRRTPEETLAHEWAHKVYYEDLPEGVRSVWASAGPNMIGQIDYDQAARDYYGRLSTLLRPDPNEVYAEVADNPQLLARMEPYNRRVLFPQLDQEEWDRRHNAWNTWPSEADRARAAYPLQPAVSPSPFQPVIDSALATPYSATPYLDELRRIPSILPRAEPVPVGTTMGMQRVQRPNFFPPR